MWNPLDNIRLRFPPVHLTSTLGWRGRIPFSPSKMPPSSATPPQPFKRHQSFPAPQSAPKPSQYIFVCQHTTCRRQGAALTLQRFQEAIGEGAIATGCGCLGQCGNGPTVVILPDQLQFTAVSPDQIPQILEQAFSRFQDMPPRATPPEESLQPPWFRLGWLMVGILLLSIAVLLGLGLYQLSNR